MYNIIDAYGKLPSVKPISPPPTNPWLDAAMTMRARASDMHRAAERRMPVCRLLTLVCGMHMCGSNGQWRSGIPTITVRKYTRGVA